MGGGGCSVMAVLAAGTAGTIVQTVNEGGKGRGSRKEVRARLAVPIRFDSNVKGFASPASARLHVCANWLELFVLKESR